MLIKPQTETVNISIIEVYAPTQEHYEEDIDSFYEQLGKGKEGTQTTRDNSGSGVGLKRKSRKINQ